LRNSSEERSLLFLQKKKKKKTVTRCVWAGKNDSDKNIRNLVHTFNNKKKLLIIMSHEKSCSEIKKCMKFGKETLKATTLTFPQYGTKECVLYGKICRSKNYSLFFA
jgi:hypothetical protein